MASDMTPKNKKIKLEESNNPLKRSDDSEPSSKKRIKAETDNPLKRSDDSEPSSKKRIKAETDNPLKRSDDSEPSSKKRIKAETDNPLKRADDSEPSSKRINAETENFQAMKRKNFVTACQQVSYKAYYDHRTRLQLLYLPVCLQGTVCKHHEYKNALNIKEMASYAEESVKIETKTNMWCEALEVCILSITPDQYLSANVLREIVEIMLNAHEDNYAGYTIPYLIEKCQQILSQNFSTHPPCLTKTLRKCYKNFLTSSMDLKEKTFTNRTLFDYDKGIVKYCMNRLEYEISSESKDEALLDKYENIPEEMKESVKGLHWQKEKFEIFELLERPDRIERLMAVLESIVELLQFDLAIWHKRYTNNLGCHIMRTHKPLMAFILWSDNVLYTGVVNNNCRQILRLFVHLIHLKYPEEHIRIMTTWLNVIIQTFYICETNSNSDYPNTGKYSAAFCKEFYKLVAEMPNETIIKLLERIQPTFMQHLLGTLHIKTLLSTQQDDVLKIFIDFLKKSQWQKFSESTKDIRISKPLVIKPRKVNVLKYLSKKCNVFEDLTENNEIIYPKLDSNCINKDSEIEQNDVVHVLYIAMEAYLDAYSVQSVQDTWDCLNKQLHTEMQVQNNIPEFCSYTVTENFIKKYRSVYLMLKEVTVQLQELKNNEKLPDSMKIFANIGLLE